MSKSSELTVLTDEQKAYCIRVMKECFVYFVENKLNNRYYKCKYNIKDIEDFFDDSWEEQQKYTNQVIEKFSRSFERTNEIQELLIQKYMVLGEYEDTDEVNEKPKPYEPTDEEIDAMPLRSAIFYLREPRKSKDTFPWALVERWIKEQDQAGKWGGKPADCIDTDEYKWCWVSSMANLSGIGGWLQVDVANKKQGEFKFVCIS